LPLVIHLLELVEKRRLVDLAVLGIRICRSVESLKSLLKERVVVDLICGRRLFWRYLLLICCCFAACFAVVAGSLEDTDFAAVSCCTLSSDLLRHLSVLLTLQY